MNYIPQCSVFPVPVYKCSCYAFTISLSLLVLKIRFVVMNFAELTKGLEKTQGFFCLPAICGAFLWVVEFALSFNILAISANRVYRLQVLGSASVKKGVCGFAVMERCRSGLSSRFRNTASNLLSYTSICGLSV